jgi:hypothetical protein
MHLTQGLPCAPGAAHVAEDARQARGVECLLHCLLLEFVAREHHPPQLVLLQQAADEMTPERTRAT